MNIDDYVKSAFVSFEYLLIAIDSCAYCPPMAEERMAISELRKLEGRKIILLETTESVAKEMKGMISNRLLRKPLEDSLIAGTNIDEGKRKAIKEILFPAKSNLKKSDQSDVEHIVQACSCGFNLFVTFNLKHLIGDEGKIRDKIYNEFKLYIVTPRECLEIVKKLEKMEFFGDIRGEFLDRF